MDKKTVFYRPIWTCGRYNSRKRVAIMYNLIAGASYYFVDYSADVVGFLLSVKRNEQFSLIDAEKKTGISQVSLQLFFSQLSNEGLITQILPDKTVVDQCRDLYAQERKQSSWVDMPTEEKLPMFVTNAEQQYFEMVDNGKTICSCMFELTYRCSEMCIHCYNPGATRNKDEISHRGDINELSLNDYKRIIDDMCDNGLVKVCLSGGDPFSKENIWDLIDYLYEKEVAFDIFTNGQSILKDVTRLADYFPRLVGISIYSGVAEHHDSITRVDGSWYRSMMVIRQLSDLAVPMNLKCCVMQPNVHSYYMVADIAREYGAYPQFELNISESNDGDLCAKQLRLTQEQLNVVLRDSNISLYVGPEVPNYGGQKRDMMQPSCGAGATSFCLSPNGDLRACSAFTQVYGNLRNQNVLQVFQDSDVLREWRSATLNDYTECGRYEYCDYCNLCAGLNYTEHLDFRKPAETNCYMAKSRYNLACLLSSHYKEMNRTEFVEALKNLPKAKVDLHRHYDTKG